MKKFLLSSMHSIVISVVILASFSLAWFSDITSNKGNSIKAGTYGIETTVSGNAATSDASKNVFYVNNGEFYDFTLRPEEGSIDKGFCVVSAGDEIYHTAQVTSGDSGEQEFKFRIIFEGSGTRKIQFIPYWGEYSESVHPEGKLIENNNVVSGGDVFNEKYNESKR